MKHTFVAIVALLLTFTVQILVNQPSGGPTILSFLVLPFYILGTVLSGNSHAASEWVVWLGLYKFIYAFLFSISSVFIKKANLHFQKETEKEGSEP